MAKVKYVRLICGKCGGTPVTGNYYCRSCHAGNMRTRRQEGREPAKTPEQKKRANARSLAFIRIVRGHLTPLPCKHCGGTTNIQIHHKDYDKPLEVEWICRSCHMDHHYGSERPNRKRERVLKSGP